MRESSDAGNGEKKANLAGPLPRRDPGGVVESGRGGERPPDLRIKADPPFLSGQPTTQTTFSFDPKFAFSPLDWMSNTFDRSFGVESKCVSLVTIPLAFLEG